VFGNGMESTIDVAPGVDISLILDCHIYIFLLG